MTWRKRLADCQAFRVFEQITGMHLSEVELATYEEMARGSGLSMEELFDRSVETILKHQALLQAELASETRH